MCRKSVACENKKDVKKLKSVSEARAAPTKWGPHTMRTYRAVAKMMYDSTWIVKIFNAHF